MTTPRAPQILLTCGTGGVGKTTLAAALGLACARSGARTLVLTIDPARRLAHALGLDAIGHTPRRIWPDPAQPHGGHCDCMMLDAKRTFDHIVERYSPTPEAARTILTNPLYRQLSSMIAGSQEYMAMEQLYMIAHDHPYDIVILDTPPSQHALDFFQAPARMLNALTDSMLLLFIKPTLLAGKLGARFLARGTETLMKLFGTITGADMMREIAGLIISTATLFDGFRERAKDVQAMLRRKTTGILLVTVPEPQLIADANTFLHETRRTRMRLHQIVINRMPPATTTTPAPLPAAPPALATVLTRNHRSCADAYEQARTLVQQLAAPKLPPVIIPQRDHEITNLGDLWQLADAVASCCPALV